MSFWADPAVQAIALRRPAPAEPMIHSRRSRARLATVHPYALATSLRALGDAAGAQGLSDGTRAVYSSHVSYFLELGQLLGFDIHKFGAPEHAGGLPPLEESRVRMQPPAPPTVTRPLTETAFRFSNSWRSSWSTIPVPTRIAAASTMHRA